MADLGTKAHPVARFEYLRELADIVDCAEMDNHREIEACTISTSASWAKRSLLATLLSQGATMTSAEATGGQEIMEYQAPLPSTMITIVGSWADRHWTSIMMGTLVITLIIGMLCGCVLSRAMRRIPVSVVVSKLRLAFQTLSLGL